MDLGGLGCADSETSDALPDLTGKFKRGDEVTVIRRMSWVCPVPGEPGRFIPRKDVKEGTKGIIEGYADVENRKVLL